VADRAAAFIQWRAQPAISIHASRARMDGEQYWAKQFDLLIDEKSSRP
jgi:hypothetical protein